MMKIANIGAAIGMIGMLAAAEHDKWAVRHNTVLELSKLTDKTLDDPEKIKLIKAAVENSKNCTNYERNTLLKFAKFLGNRMMARKAPVADATFEEVKEDDK
jgi:hypothetical protein